MKTAVSIPTPLFEAGERQAKKRGISRSQLYAEALEKLLAKDREAEITARLNEYYDNEIANQEDASAEAFIAEAARRVFAATEW